MAEAVPDKIGCSNDWRAAKATDEGRVTAGERGRSLAMAEAVPDKIGCSNDWRAANAIYPRYRQKKAKEVMLIIHIFVYICYAVNRLKFSTSPTCSRILVFEGACVGWHAAFAVRQAVAFGAAP
jgi:hypothetical protein